MNGDYIKINRKILEWEWYKNEHTKNLFLHCLLKANWKDGKFEGKVVGRGSFITSIKKLSSELNLTEDEVRTALKHLTETGEVTKQTTNKYTVITVNNYAVYQEVTKQIPNKSQTIPKPFPTIEEGKKGRRKEDIIVSKDTICQTGTVRRIVEAWNTLESYGIKAVIRLGENSKRRKMLEARIREYGEESILAAIENIKRSDFLKGKNKYTWVVTFDWFVLPSNFPKVLEGQYDNKKSRQQGIKVKDNNNFERRNYDMEALENELLGGNHGAGNKA